MWFKNTVQTLIPSKKYSRAELFQIFRAQKKALNESTFRWLLYRLQQEQYLIRLGYDSYIFAQSAALPTYKPIYSAAAMKLLTWTSEQYPDVPFVLFESVLLNEFLTHQISQNTIFIHVEKSVSSFIFEALKLVFDTGILYNPGLEEFKRYRSKDCIVVSNLVSQSPIDHKEPYHVLIEKMLVDILAEKTIASTFSPSEYPSVFENALDRYRVDRQKMNRYAKRRNRLAEVKKYTDQE